MLCEIDVLTKRVQVSVDKSKVEVLDTLDREIEQFSGMQELIKHTKFFDHALELIKLKSYTDPRMLILKMDISIDLICDSDVILTATYPSQTDSGLYIVLYLSCI